ncbi:hypothetical protein ACWGLG_16345 [Streptomyces antimycoticus]
MNADEISNEITGGDAHTVIQAGTTGPINANTTVNNSPQITGDNANVNIINGDNHAPISFGN